MGAYPKSKEVQSKTRTKKTQKPGIRYFNETGQDRDVRKVNLSSREFTGEVIEVDQKKQQKNTKFNFKSKNVKKLIKNQKKPKKIPEELLKKYKRGEKVENTGVKTNFFKEKQQRKEVYLEYAVEQAARTEILLPEQQGFIVPDSEEITSKYRQDEIVQNVDIQSAAKYFKLNLEFGPYSLRYTKNGRHLLLGGRRGHVAAFDWVTKKLLCEINVMEEVADVSWLHVHTMFACAQKNWVYIYDSQGTELHCIKRLHRINRMEFLPYHFLLAAGSGNGYVSWLDVSIGELVGNFNTHLGEIRLMHQNPSNGVLCIGGGKGVVTMWSPKVREPLAKMLCHSTPMSGLTVDPKGVHMVTSGLDRLIKVWDIRSLNGPMAQYSLRLPANQIEVSQRGVLAFTQGNYCELYTNLLLGNGSESPYLRQSCAGFISDMSFCPYEDILGIATTKGFQSLLVPGSGEPNYDALEDNPFQTSKQRREHEVHALLEKVPPELITLDASDISGVDVPTLQEKVDVKLSLFYVKPPEIDFKSRRKMKGRGGSVKAARNKQIVKDLNRKEFFGELRKTKENIINEHKIKDDDNFIPLVTDTKPSVLDRFNSKNKRK